MIEAEDFAKAHEWLMENHPPEDITNLDALHGIFIDIGFEWEAAKKEIVSYFMEAAQTAESPKEAANFTNALVAGMIFASVAHGFSIERNEEALNNLLKGGEGGPS